MEEKKKRVHIYIAPPKILRLATESFTPSQPNHNQITVKFPQFIINPTPKNIANSCFNKDSLIHKLRIKIGLNARRKPNLTQIDERKNAQFILHKAEFNAIKLPALPNSRSNSAQRYATNPIQKIFYMNMQKKKSTIINTANRDLTPRNFHSKRNTTEKELHKVILNLLNPNAKTSRPRNFNYDGDLIHVSKIKSKSKYKASSKTTICDSKYMIGNLTPNRRIHAKNAKFLPPLERIKNSKFNYSAFFEGTNRIMLGNYSNTNRENNSDEKIFPDLHLIN